MKILVLGATGMLGSTIFSYLYSQKADVFGVVRNCSMLSSFSFSSQKRMIINADVTNINELIKVFVNVKPNVVINCIGIIKQKNISKDPEVVLPINSIFPHQLANLCLLANIRLIHFSTDCVFSGKKGLYIETDNSDADDLYGQSKYIGEISNLENVITIRTSIIGHGLQSNFSLVDWFLSQDKSVKGYVNAIFSGMPTVEHARIIYDYILPNRDLFGLYHVAAEPINKYDLLKLIAKCYRKKIEIIPDYELKIDRSLSAERFNKITSYQSPSWFDLIDTMRKFHTRDVEYV